MITPLPQMNTRCSISHNSFILVIACHFPNKLNFNFECCNFSNSSLCLWFTWSSESFLVSLFLSLQIKLFFSPFSQAPRPWTTPTGCLTASRPLHLSWVAFGCCTCWRTYGRHWSSWTTRRRTTFDVRYLIRQQKEWRSGCMDDW